MKETLADVGPELLPGVTAHPAEIAKQRPSRCTGHRCIAIRTPGIRDEVATRNRDGAGVGEHWLAILILCEKRHLNHTADPILKGLAGCAKISRIITPQPTESAFHHITGSNA